MVGWISTTLLKFCFGRFNAVFEKQHPRIVQVKRYMCRLCHFWYSGGSKIQLTLFVPISGQVTTWGISIFSHLILKSCTYKLIWENDTFTRRCPEGWWFAQPDFQRPTFLVCSRHEIHWTDEQIWSCFANLQALPPCSFAATRKANRLSFDFQQSMHRLKECDECPDLSQTESIPKAIPYRLCTQWILGEVDHKVNFSVDIFHIYFIDSEQGRRGTTSRYIFHIWFI